jgi:hypothetical protein
MNKDVIVARLTESVLAARGTQVRRKDKDLMDDTGGTSKGREREPFQRPPRDDVKHRDRSKDKPAQDRDIDTDTDKDLKKSSIHPLTDLFRPSTYTEKVQSCLTHVIMDVRHISEKAFAAVDAAMAESKGVVQSNLDLVVQFETAGARPELCAEVLYGTVLASESCENNLIKSSVSRVGNSAARAMGILSRFPQTLKSLVQREG